MQPLYRITYIDTDRVDSLSNNVLHQRPLDGFPRGSSGEQTHSRAGEVRMCIRGCARVCLVDAGFVLDANKYTLF
jgi:hypothetical protein